MRATTFAIAFTILFLLIAGCLAPGTSQVKELLLRGSATPCQVASPHFADLHIHPFERFFQRREAKGRFVLFLDRAPLRRLQHSGLSLIVASLVMPQHTGLSVAYSQAIPGSATHQRLQHKIRLSISQEIKLARSLLALENLLLGCCSQQQKRMRNRAIDRFRQSAQLRRWRHRAKGLVGHLQRQLDKHLRWRLRKQKQAFLCPLEQPTQTKTATSCGKPFAIVTTAAQARRAINAGKIAIVLALEQLGYLTTPDDVDFFYQQGIRLSTLTHLSDNCLTGSADIPWAHGGITLMQKGLSGFKAHLPARKCSRPFPPMGQQKAPAQPHMTACPTQTTTKSLLQLNGNQGLTKRGLQIIWQMIRRGMLLDLSHSTATSLRQLLWCQAYQANANDRPRLPPFLLSHTNARLTRPGMRLPEYPVSGEHLRAIYKGGGMVGMGFHRDAIEHMYPQPRHPHYGKLTPTLPSLLPTPSGLRTNGQRRELWELRSILHNMHSLIMGHGGPRAIAFGTDYNGRINPPDLFPFADKLPQLLTLLKRKQCSLYKQMANSANAFLTLWSRTENIAASWRRKPPIIKDICPTMQAQAHTSCPWTRTK